MSFFENLAHQISAKPKEASHRELSNVIVRAGDVDEFVELVRGYRLGFTQLEKGPFLAEAVQMQLSDVLLSAARYGRAVIQLGEPPANKMTFAMLMSGPPTLWQGHEFGANDILFGTPGIEMDMISKAGYCGATASFPLDLVEKIAEYCGRPLVARSPMSSIVSLGYNKADVLRTALWAFFTDAVACPLDPAGVAWAKSKQEDLLRLLLTSIDKSVPKAKSVSNGERARVLRAALAAINDQPEDVFTVGDLCRIAKASERTLDYAFTERFGLAPAQYMKARRLNAARVDLSREHEPSMKIVDVANKWGFWHLGQFAKDYRSWFGELPSDTYERRRARNPGRSINNIDTRGSSAGSK
jgi:AraC family transcriptional regulator, ethanolamine operon transcriptional activator